MTRHNYVKPGIWGLILAAGSGRRTAEATGNKPKQFLSYRGAPLYWRSALAMSACGRISGLVFVFAPEFVERERARLAKLNAGNALGLPFFIEPGGRLRQDSVFNGLKPLKNEVPGCSHVLVHDAARPFVSPGLVRAICGALDQGALGVAPALAITDTVKIISGGRVSSTADISPALRTSGTLERQTLATVQTPQGFCLRTLYAAHEACREKGLELTDDAAMLELAGIPVALMPGERGNIKITTPEDLPMLDRPPAVALPCCGFGYDVHRYAGPVQEGRPMKLGGVSITGAPRVMAHSDGDVLLHALADAILGCACAGDIGVLFPDSDPAFCNLNSAIIVDEALRRAREAGVEIMQADLTIVAQAPKISPWREQIRRNVARIMQLDEAMINVKATTEEGLGFTGAKEGLKAIAAVSGLRRREELLRQQDKSAE